MNKFISNTMYLFYKYFLLPLGLYTCIASQEQSRKHHYSLIIFIASQKLRNIVLYIKKKKRYIHIINHDYFEKQKEMSIFARN